MRLNKLQTSVARRGVVLLVVLALLTLFAVVAITFVFYSEQEAANARLYVDSTTVNRPDPDLLLTHVLNQFMFGTNNRDSALCTNNLLTNMYGAPGNGPISVPFNGLGRRKGLNDARLPNLDIAHAVNIGRYYTEATYGSFNAPYTFPDENAPFLGVVGDPFMRNLVPNPVTGLLEDKSLVLYRSFVRPCQVRDGGGTMQYFDPYNSTGLSVGDYNDFWNWTNNGLLTGLGTTLTRDEARAMVVRPGRWDHPNFPMPADAGGDVRNLSPGWSVLLPDGTTEHNGNDSYWMDLHFPVQKASDGRYYKPLFAMFVTDLDSKVNVNIHGNIMGANYAHASSTGWGPWEVNPYKVLNTNAAEALRLQMGSNTIPGRLGAPYTVDNTTPGPFTATPSVAVPGFNWPTYKLPPYYSGADYDARKAGSLQPSDRIKFPDLANATNVPPDQPNQFERFPRFDLAAGYNSRSGGAVETDLVPSKHPLYFNPFRPFGDDRTFGPWNMESLLRHGDTNIDAQYGDLRAILGTNLAASAKARRLLTTHSFDVVRGGVTPWWYRLDMSNPYRYRLGNGATEFFPTGYDDTNPMSAAIPTPSTAPTYAAMEFINNSWRANIGNLPRVDVNRPLPAYPPFDPATGRIDMTQYTTAFEIATQARRDLTQDIYNRLLFATGADPNGTQPEEINARRWLAQLAVNIVDMRDEDDFVTAFNFDPTNTNVNSGWVYGTELPRVVINEAYAQYTRPDSATDDYRTYMWAELYNPLHADTSLSDNGSARLFIPETALGAMDQIECYRLAILKKTGGNKLRDKDNGMGEVIVVSDVHSYLANNVAGSKCQVTFLNAPANARMLNCGANHYHGVLAGASKMVTDPMSGQPEQRITPDFSQAWNYGFYMVGPNMKDPADAAKGQMTFPVSRDMGGTDQIADADVPDPLLKENTMSYTLTYPAGQNPNHVDQKPTLILQRLMCPNLPRQQDPALPLYNNYVTIDYAKDVEVFNGDAPAGTPFNAEANFSIGKKQPYASGAYRDLAANPNDWSRSQYQPQNPGNFPTQNPRNQPKHTFYRHNALEELYYNETLAMGDYLNYGSGAMTPENMANAAAAGQTLWRTNAATNSKVPFDWLTHLDRDYTSLIELLQVSGFRPHELTQQFVLGERDYDNIPYAHRAPWIMDATRNVDLGANPNNNRLYRALEFLETRSRVAGVSTQVIRCTTPVNTPGMRQVTFKSYVNNPAWEARWVIDATNGDYVWGFTPNGARWVIRKGTTLIVEPGTNPSTGQNETIRVDSVNATAMTITAYFQKTHALTLTDDQPGGPSYYEVLVPYMEGRVPGKININTVFDYETFSALCDIPDPSDPRYPGAEPLHPADANIIQRADRRWHEPASDRHTTELGDGRSERRRLDD